MSFYRIYRPQVIEQIDNSTVRELLGTLAQKKKKDLPHAYLFYGPKGAGKTTAARILAKLFNCTTPRKNGFPCGKCDACLSIAENRNIDILEIDAASNRGIDEIRELRNGIALSPASSLYKVYIIDEVHMLTTEAFNALLKTLEEPPGHAVFVLATTDREKVPATIQSRCFLVPFSRAQQKELLTALNKIIKKEKIRIDDDALTILASYAEGSFRDGVKLLEQVSFHKGKITHDVVGKLLPVTEESVTAQFLDHVFSKDIKHALSDINSLVDRGRDIKTFLVDCLYILETQLIELSQGENTQSVGSFQIQNLIRKFSEAYVEIKSSPIAQLPLELAVVEYTEEHGTKPTEQTRKSADTEESKFRVVPSQVPHSSVLKDTKTEKTDENGGNQGGLLTLEKLTEHWPDFISAMKSYNHSVAGFLRSSRPKEVKSGIVTVEAFYLFHKEKLSEVKTREALGQILKKLFGEKVKVEIVLGKK